MTTGRGAFLLLTAIYVNRRQTSLSKQSLHFHIVYAYPLTPEVNDDVREISGDQETHVRTRTAQAS